MDEFGETKKKVDVGVILDLNSLVGSVANACIPMAISDFYAAHPNFRTRLSLHVRSSDDVLAAAFTALELINKEEVNAIIGPQTSMQARVVMDIGQKAQVPIISSSATSPSLSTTQNPFFVRTALDDSSQAKAIAAIIHAYEWHEVVLLYENTEYGSGLIPYLSDEFQRFDIRVSSRFSVSTNYSNLTILKMLNNVMAMQTRVIVVHMTSSLGSKLFFLAKEATMISEGYVWIITDGLSNLLDPMGAEIIGSMQGVLGIRPYIPQSKRLEKFKKKWKRGIHSSSTKLNIYGYWAYDTVWALAKSVEMVPHKSSGVTRRSNRRNASQIPEIRVSAVGRSIRNEIVKKKFKGLSGDFSLVRGQLQSSAFEIINVVDKMEKVIGYWTVENGLTAELGKPVKATYSTSYHELKPPIWPGNTKAKPRGWTILVVGKKLRIEVPVKPGFDAYLKVNRDPYTDEFIVMGFSYDVFKEALAILPFPIGNDTSSGTYNELLYDVKLQKFDAAVGDITILANRSRYVDFTLPYLQSHVSMVVKRKDDGRKNMWIFLKPLSWDLRLSSVGFGTPNQQRVWGFGTATSRNGFWFSFSTLVFAHREKIISNLSRVVLIIWIFVVLILTQSYTASLASMLTVQRLQPAVVDVNELKKNGDFVGYETGSFVKDLLVKQLDLDESKLKNYGTAEEFDEALSKGSQNGGVGAIFGAQHCVELFLAKYCNKYMTAGPTYKTDGLGFAFPQGSPLVAYISRAILSVTENKLKMDALEQKYFSQLKPCQIGSERTTISSDSLGLYSFGGLFIITAVASVCSLIIYFTEFLQSHWNAAHTVHDSSVWSRISELVKYFDGQSPPQSVVALANDGHEGADAVVGDNIPPSHREGFCQLRVLKPKQELVLQWDALLWAPTRRRSLVSSPWLKEEGSEGIFNSSARDSRSVKSGVHERLNGVSAADVEMVIVEEENPINEPKNAKRLRSLQASLNMQKENSLVIPNDNISAGLIDQANRTQ
ncbi:glutamate receptor 2.1-like [Hibiscus syriacus]|uniref:glutamate receptor 2.1-like n=1 Tax=Hibiscus syriacus TaxID=106335 RepID=UPI0019235532|nr:glutamate receptor 2.1-like [Hibiscus syriacus]